MRHSDRGNISVLVAAVLVVAVLLCTALARLAGAAAEKARAENAADAAALAAADGMALGDTVPRACARARVTAADNGARLLSCANRSSGMQVDVAFGRARADARAEFTAADVPARYDAPAIRASSARAALLSRYSFQLPHFGDWTHDGHPSSHEHPAMRSSVART
jgi:secretion/DNA translocation related TadE-like protein